MVEIELHLDSNQTREPGKFANPLRCVKRVFYLGGESCLGGLPNLCDCYSIFGCLLDGYYTVHYAPPNALQRYDFTGLTPNDYMDMDSSSIFGLNSRFGAVWEGIRAFPHGLTHTC
jgi:hypothetical protein